MFASADKFILIAYDYANPDGTIPVEIYSITVDIKPEIFYSP
ncbi:MAG: hypothetical protein ACTHMV_08095 [Chitinophagaceae bacterium]